jgi:hypothetical protein
MARSHFQPVDGGFTMMIRACTTLFDVPACVEATAKKTTDHVQTGQRGQSQSHSVQEARTGQRIRRPDRPHAACRPRGAAPFCRALSNRQRRSRPFPGSRKPREFQFYQHERYRKPSNARTHARKLGADEAGEAACSVVLHSSRYRQGERCDRRGVTSFSDGPSRWHP